jgi:NADH/NAD ratio-sensing transcriptional regulator Rex
MSKSTMTYNVAVLRRVLGLLLAGAVVMLLAIVGDRYQSNPGDPCGELRREREQNTIVIGTENIHSELAQYAMEKNLAMHYEMVRLGCAH